MDPRHHPVPSRPAPWHPLVSPGQWAILAHALAECPEALDDLRVVLAQLSPGVRSALIANLMEALAAGVLARRAVWSALAVTGHEVKLCSAAALGRLHALADDAPGARVRPIRPTD